MANAMGEPFCKAWMFLPSWLPMIGNSESAEWMTLSWAPGSPARTSPRMLTSNSSSGKTAPKAEKARLLANTPALSSPNFLTTPKISPSEPCPCWKRSA